MKKIKNDAPRQARRQRALARFTVAPTRHADSAYLARKAVELAALKRHVPQI
jgi:hypothetical protein